MKVNEPARMWPINIKYHIQICGLRQSIWNPITKGKKEKFGKNMKGENIFADHQRNSNILLIFWGFQFPFDTLRAGRSEKNALHPRCSKYVKKINTL